MYGVFFSLYLKSELLVREYNAFEVEIAAAKFQVSDSNQIPL